MTTTAPLTPTFRRWQPDSPHQIAAHLGGFESVEEILRGVVARHSLELADLLRTSRKRIYVEARREAVVLLRDRRAMSYAEIAAALGFRWHTCVIGMYRQGKAARDAAKGGG